MSTPNHHEWYEFREMFMRFKRETNDFNDKEKIMYLIKKHPTSLKLLGIILGYSVFKFSEVCGFDRDTFYRFSSGKYNLSRRALLKISDSFTRELSSWYLPDEYTLKYRFYFWIKNKNKSRFFTPSSPTREDFIRAYKELEVATNGFKRIDQRSLQSVPRSVLVIRHLMGISQKKFAKMFSISNVSVQYWEYCAAMPRYDAEKISEKFKLLLPEIKAKRNLSIESAVGSYETFKDPAKMWAKNHSMKDMQEMSLKMLKSAPRSSQEKKIKELLVNRNFTFAEQYAILSPTDEGGKNSMIVADFAIPEKEPKMVIEASNFPNIRGVITLAWKGFRLSKYKPNIIRICFINKVKCTRMKHEKGIRILNEAYNHVIDENNYEELRRVISENI